jgi:quercetin dioxygenase-like cupin family protein
MGTSSTHGGQETAPTSGDRRHGPGETTGSPQRPAQRLRGRVLVFDLHDEASRLRHEPAWQRGERNAITLAKEPNLRVVLTALKHGARVQEHQVDTQFTLQVLEDHLQVHLPSETIDLAAGQMLVVEAGVPHDVEALEESVFLLTISGAGAHE